MAPSLTSLLAASCCLSTAWATYLGFNTGAMHPDNSAKVQADFQAEFEAAQNLVNAPGSFSSIRLYTNIQFGTTNTPIEAFPAAIATNTTMLLGIWASGADNIDNELAALKSAIDKYGTQFADLVVAISVGSEDLYRQSEPGLRNKAGVGNTPQNIKKFIQDTRNAIADTPLASKPVGLVPTAG
jgi:glucan endo-1,3-beta-D-glucosidase